VLRFDYKRSAEGSTVNSGIEFRLTNDLARWLIDASPPSPLDSQPEPKVGVPQTDQLDYALLRLQDAAGATTIGAAGDFRDAKRGWIAVTPPAAAPKQGAPLFIMQHPAGQPLKLAFSGNGIIGVNANSTRVRYDVNTEAGSSGSPCFDLNWSLVAIHHSGDPTFSQPTYNEGIPIGAIVALMNQRGVAGVLGPAT
jgi:hypothetical protein